MEFIRYVDEAVLFGVQTLHNPFLDRIMVFITHLNDNGLFWIAVGLLCLIRKDYRNYGLAILASLLLSLLFTNIIIKNLVQRPRPFDTYSYTPLIVETSWSFPSGHTSSSFAAAVSLVINLKWKGLPFLLLAILISFTRLYVQVHYFTDVLAGVAVGSLCGLMGTAIVKRIPMSKEHQS